MQNMLLLHLREQKRLTPNRIEQLTGIPSAQYLQYEQGTSSIPETDIQLLSTLFKIKPDYLRTYSNQLDYFSYSKSIIQVKEKRIEQFTRVLKRYIAKAPQLMPKSFKL